MILARPERTRHPKQGGRYGALAASWLHRPAGLTAAEALHIAIELALQARDQLLEVVIVVLEERAGVSLSVVVEAYVGELSIVDGRP